MAIARGWVVSRVWLPHELELRGSFRAAAVLSVAAERIRSSGGGDEGSSIDSQALALRSSRPGGRLLRMAVVAAVYVVTAKIGLELSVSYSNATPVWAPTGIALAAVLLFGRWMWPAVAVGAFVANALTGVPLWVAGLIAVGNTLEAVVGADLLVRFGGFRASLERVRDVLVLVFYAAIVSTAVSATIGVVALGLSAEIPWDRFGYAWQLWWHGDAMGDLIVAPLLLAWGVAIRRRDRPRGAVEEVVLVGALILLSYLVFFGGSWRYPYILFPFLVWGALRFRQRGATTVVFVMTGMAISGILAGSVPVGGVTPTASIQIFQTLMGLLAITSLILTASVAEKELSRAELDEAASLLRATLDSTTDGIIVIDLDGRITSFNRRFLDLWGIGADAIHPGDDATVLAPLVDRVTRPEDVFAGESRLYASDVESFELLELEDGRFFERYSQPQRIDDVPVGRVWSFRDVTKQREMEEARGRFIDDAAHELRNPVAVIMGMTDLLRSDSSRSDDEIDQALDALRRQASRMALLLERMLDLGRLEKAIDVETLTPVPLADVVDDALGSMIVPEGRSITASIPAGLCALGDRGALEQILVNLLTNACRYGGLNIQVVATSADGEVELVVSDDGRGVPERLVPHIFDPFRRGHSDADGFGLGLSIVRRLAQRMHGDIAYVSGGLEGAAFRVRLRAV